MTIAQITEKERTKRIVLLMIASSITIFIMGFFSSFILYNSNVVTIEKPLSLETMKSNFTPYDFISYDEIEVYPDRVVIKVKNASLGSYEPTGSMMPLLDKGSNGIRIKPKSESDIHIGDIVTFQKGNELIIHRVIERGYDDIGLYFITRGDNNYLQDEKIRFSNIKFLTIGIIY